MQRVRNWWVDLVEWQEEVVGEPFEWGRTDCGSLVWGALHAMYKSPPIPGSVPVYESEQEAIRAHLETGGVAAMLEAGGSEHVDLNFARRGDILVGLDEQGGMPGAAVVVERHFIVASQEEGVTRRRLRDLREEAPDSVEVWRPPNE